MNAEPKTLEVWAIVELMGHVRIAGKLTEEERFGSKMGRLEIPCPPKPDCPACNGTGIIEPPADNPAEYPRRQCRMCPQFVTQWFGGASVYRISPVSEEVARAVARKSAYMPVNAWELPRPALTGPRNVVDLCVSDPPPFDHDDDEEDDDEEIEEEDDDKP